MRETPLFKNCCLCCQFDDVKHLLWFCLCSCNTPIVLGRVYTRKPLALPWVFPCLVHGTRPTSLGRIWTREHVQQFIIPFLWRRYKCTNCMWIKHWQLYSKNRSCHTYQCSSPNSFWAVDDQWYTPLASRMASAKESRLVDSSEVISLIASARKLNSSMPANVWCHIWEEDRVYSMNIEYSYIHISQAYSYTCPYCPRFHIRSAWNQEVLQYGHYLLHSISRKSRECSHTCTIHGLVLHVAPIHNVVYIGTYVHWPVYSLGAEINLCT